MINMKDDMVTTNLRLPRQDWLMIKTLAAEEGKSFNEYINWLVEDIGKKVMVFGDRRELERKGKMTLADLRRRVAKTKGKKLELNEDDKVIYGL